MLSSKQITEYGIRWEIYVDGSIEYLPVVEINRVLGLSKSNPTRSIQRAMPDIPITKGRIRSLSKPVNLVPLSYLPMLITSYAIAGNRIAQKLLGVSTQPQRSSSNPKLYLAITECGSYVKIGVSVNPQTRLKGIQTGCPIKVEILKELPVKGAYQVEKELHRTLLDYRTSGEWFDAQIISLINWDALGT